MYKQQRKTYSSSMINYTDEKRRGDESRKRHVNLGGLKESTDTCTNAEARKLHDLALLRE